MPDKTKPIRAFIAIKLPDFIKKVLKDTQKTMLANGIKAKYISPENMHLTLKFLGNIDYDLLPEIKRNLTKSAQYVKPIKLSLKGIGTFPNSRSPKVIWAGINGETQKLATLHARLEQRLSNIGIPEEKREFHGHLTLARLKKNKLSAQKFERLLQQTGQFESVKFTADRLILFQSRLMPKGPIYIELFSAKFGTKL
ncbi:MAG: RNA 2',3'-cyclic phosphodiesterase [Deltaproteobacteria bacterium]|jgi:2'-5' RNA ligase|nr:RNA 2',3'-cyclic phosphodiesterase [Deltaproteobacteria bacterium]